MRLSLVVSGGVEAARLLVFVAGLRGTGRSRSEWLGLANTSREEWSGENLLSTLVANRRDGSAAEDGVGVCGDDGEVVLGRLARR